MKSISGQSTLEHLGNIGCFLVGRTACVSRKRWVFPRPSKSGYSWVSSLNQRSARPLHCNSIRFSRQRVSDDYFTSLMTMAMAWLEIEITERENLLKYDFLLIELTSLMNCAGFWQKTFDVTIAKLECNSRWARTAFNEQGSKFLICSGVNLAISPDKSATCSKK